MDLTPGPASARVPIIGRPAALPLDQLVMRSGRSWWEVKLRGGRTWGEWQTAEAHRDMEMPLEVIWPRSRWEELPHARIEAARLWCPNGMIGEVEAPQAGGRPVPRRIFQFKQGMRLALPGVEATHVDAHVLGVVLNDRGDVDCWAWEPGSPWGLARFQDNLLAFRRYAPMGRLDLDVIGVRL